MVSFVTLTLLVISQHTFSIMRNYSLECANQVFFMICKAFKVLRDLAPSYICPLLYLHSCSHFNPRHSKYASLLSVT